MKQSLVNILQLSSSTITAIGNLGGYSLAAYIIDLTVPIDELYIPAAENKLLLIYTRQFFERNNYFLKLLKSSS